MIRTKAFLEANLIWKLLKFDKMSILIKKLNKYQRYNHFPCTWQLGRKDYLWKNFKLLNSFFPEDYNFIPETYILPEDQTNFIKAHDDHPEKVWIVKPVASSRGRGIRLLANINSLPKKCLVSKYLEKPHIINNKKYDLRLYVVITSFSPLKIYLYEDGLVRFASEEYSEVTNANRFNRFMHLTNYSVNKNSSNFDKNISLEDNFLGSKWTLSAYKKYFKENNLDFDLLWNKIKNIVAKAVICAADQTISTVKQFTQHTNNLFELYGFDILIDESLNPWLLEINLNPSLNCDTELDLKVKSTLMTDIFNLIGVIPYAHENITGNIEDFSSKVYNLGKAINKEPTTLFEDTNRLKKVLLTLNSANKTTNEFINNSNNSNNNKSSNNGVKMELEEQEEKSNNGNGKNCNSISKTENIKEKVKKLLSEYEAKGLDLDIGKY